MLQPCPILVVLDTVYLMDEAGWKLLDLLRDEVEGMAIILLMQTDTNNQPRIHPEAKNYYQTEIYPNIIAEFTRIIDLPPLRVEDLHSLMTEYLPKYI